MKVILDIPDDMFQMYIHYLLKSDEIFHIRLKHIDFKNVSNGDTIIINGTNLEEVK